MAVIVWIFLLNFLLLSKTTFSSHVHLDRVLSAVEKMIEYYKKNYRDLNVDGLFGLRVIEGHLSNIIQKYQNGTIQSMDSKIMGKLSNLQMVSTKISNDALYFVKKDDEEYFKSMQFIIGNPWALHKEYKQLQFHLQWDPSVYKQTSLFSLNEKESDKCMMELMGYQTSKKKCGVSEHCINIMTRKGLTGYGITHQLLWTMLSEQAGCSKKLSNMLVAYGRGRTENFQLEFCTNNYVEVMQVVHGTLKGRIIPRFQDLFMEQQFICPSLGFYQFLTDEFLNQILSWQKDVGCYGTMKKIIDKPTDFLKSIIKDYEYSEENNQRDKVLKFAEKFKQNKTTMNKNSVNVHPPELNLVHESNVKNLGNVRMSNNVVIQKGSDLVTKGNDKVLNLSTDSRQQKSSIKHNTVLMGQRKLLSEKEMEDGCLAHKTAVAAGALIIYLRYLILPGPKTLAENTKEMMQQRHLLNINDSGAEKIFPGATKVINPENHQKGLAMNNNVLAAQINDNDKDDDYYADENNEEEEEDGDEGDVGGGNKNVQFDDRENDNKNEDDADYEGEYEDHRNHDNKNLAVKNLAGKDETLLPKTDDTDYTYYEDKNKHDDYTNDEYDEKEDNVEKDAKDNSNDKIKLKLINESKLEDEYSQSRLQSPNGVFVIISGTIFVLLIFMYRFLKKRRVHIRYNYKTFNRV